MKHISFLRRLTAAVLSCTLCCTGMTVPAFSADDAEELPECFDWREEVPEILTPVKKQVGGTCWAHATIGCIESNLIRKGMADNSIDLSEAHLIWFTEGQGAPTDSDDPRFGSGKNLGVQAYSNGARCIQIIASLAAWQGAVNEDDVPPHSEKPVLDESLRYNSVAHLQNARYFYYVKAKDMPRTKQMLKENGPLYFTYFHDLDGRISEKNGYYNPDYSDQKRTDGELNGNSHAVMIVGWDDHYPKEYFNDDAPGDGAWIVRNSWGKYKDYYYMSYYEPSISYIASFDCESASNYSSKRSYNGSDIQYSGAPGEGKGFYTANIFEAEKDEKIAAAGYFRLRSNLGPLTYEISVYLLNPDASDPQDGVLAYRTKCTEEISGFYTVKFPESISVEKGQKYSVILKTPIGYGTYFDGSCYKKGVSYYAYYTADSTGDQQNWKDCYENELGDACLHVYTEYEGETEQILPGDMDRDGRLTAADLSLMKQAIRTLERSDLYQPAADWNGDSEINAEDAHGLLNYLLTASKLNPEKFSAALPGIEVTVSGEQVLQKSTVNGQDYALTLDLSKWEQHTTQEQLVKLSRLFWQCYPRMWARFADISDAPTEITLAVENEGYGVAEAGGNHVHIHDQWLEKCPEDFDCITHELAHIIQNGWDSDYLEDSGYIERFADCCRYEYAMDNGYYNDGQWTLQTIADESTRSTSVRFLVWLDYMYSDADTDILRNFLSVCRNEKVSSRQWENGWQKVFAGTKLAGKTIDEVWAMFAASDFANLSSYSDHGSGSELLAQYPIREKVKQLGDE